MKITFYRAPGDEEESTGPATDEETTHALAFDPSFLVPVENTWVSNDGGTTYVADPVQGEPYDFCITITNGGTVESGNFTVKFQLSGDQDPALELETEEFESLAPGAGVLAVVHYGAFANEFGVYHVQATVYSSETGQPVSTDHGFDFTIHTE